ncbi:hypothetical protein BHM03_00040439, partial [Ensete ventricosum]
ERHPVRDRPDPSIRRDGCRMRYHEEGDAIRQPSHLVAVSWPTWWGMGAITSVRHVISAGRRRAHCARSCRNYPGVRFDESWCPFCAAPV